MQQSNTLRAWRRKAISLLLALTILLGLVPGFPGASETASAHWADSYLSQLVEWGFIREDQAGYPDRALTRAEFMAIVNRAYGYHEMGETPFEDVAVEDWYYDDVGIAYTARYINGTSPTTASPNHALTRETAATILGRNMMLEESNGELLDFTDARQISSWAKGTIKSSLEHYLVSGYDDGTFRPQRNVSWGEMASMVTALVGTPLQEAGDYALGGVYGNVTITSPGVKLRDTVVSGDLYITGGVGLGGVELENVTVLGRIIASGAGQAEGGADSILLRNVTADELLVDNLQDNYVSVRADGVTEIGKTTVRTSAYIEDNTPEGLGLQYISLEAESYPEGEEPEGWVPPQLDLAGRIGEVVNRTPGSQVRAASGTVAKLTVDEAAVGSTVIIDRGTVVKELNLDTGVEVTGQGDVGKLTVNAPGCTVEMLPDEIEIRPGITATINGEEMDSVAAKESSEQPMILAGYPEAQDVVPTGLDAAFMTNKAGTIYWAVSALTDGSVGEEDLIKPPSYGNIAVKNGSVKVAKGNEETISKVAGLTPGGSYYLSAILVDGRGQRSAVKVISFTTPDNTVPAFNTGYPRMSEVSRTDSVVVVMPNKDCKLYYALLPESAAAPTENELKSSAVAGALGYGVRDVKKNVEDAFRVNDVILDETTNYVLYLWLVDADGVNKGKITPLKFTTDDETKPWFVAGPTQVKTQATSVGLEYQLSENGTVYWVAVPAGTVYPKPEPGTSYERAPLDSEYAILQVVSGMNIGSDGKFGKVSAKEGVKGAINISGLKPESVYDFYYVAKDNAGADRNYSVSVLHMTINTEDNKPPVFTQSFSNTSDGQSPRADTNIYLDVTEDVLYLGQNGGKSLLELYQETQTGTEASKLEARNQLAENLYNSIVLHKYDVQTKREETIKYKYRTDDTSTDWTIDYTQAKVESRREGGIRITFPSESLQLENGGQYCFIINDLADTSNARNPIEPDTGVDFWNYATESAKAGHNVKPFVVDLPTVNLDVPVIGDQGPLVTKDGTTEPVRMDMSFYMEPVSTSSMADSISYDVLLWSRSTMSYNLYYRIVDHDGNVLDYATNQDIMLAGTASLTADAHGWMYLGNSDLCVPPPLDEKDPNGKKGWDGRSLTAFFNNCDASQYAKLNKLSEEHHYQFVISLTQLNNWGADYRTWDDTAHMEINVAAGQSQNLDQMAGISGKPRHAKWEEEIAKGIIRGAQSIGNWQNDNNQFSDTQLLEREFNVSKVPSFTNNTPDFIFGTNGDVSINLNLTSAGTVHYAISEVDSKSKQPTLTTIREMVEGKDYTKAQDGSIIIDPNDHIQVVTNGKVPPQMYITTDGPRPPVKSGSLNEYPMPDWMKGVDSDVADADLANATDDPEKENKIIEPSNLLIVQNKWQQQVVDSGTFTPQEGINDAITSDKEKPNTTYFAYFVITSVDDYSNMSHVYIYQFTTPEAMKPAVTLRAESSGDVTMSIDVATKGAYRVISWSDAMNKDKVSILSQPFGLFTAHQGNVDTDGGIKEVDDLKDGTPEKYLEKSDGVFFTVLDALTTPYNYTTASTDPAPDGNLNNDSSYAHYYYPDRGGDATAYSTGYTVFDMYASDKARDQLYNFIKEGSLAPPETVDISNWGPTGTTNTSAPKKGEDWADTLLETGKDLNDSRYIILTYSINPKMVQSNYPAQSSQNTSLLATFRGLDFQKGKMVPPEVEDDTGASGSIQTDGLNTYKGNISIRFDRDVFLHGGSDAEFISENNLLSGAQVPLKPPLIPPKNFGSGTISVNYISGTRGFELSYSGVKLNESYSFPSGYFANGNNEESSKELRFEVKNVNGVPSLVVTWNGAKGSPWTFPLEDDSGDYRILLESTTSGALNNNSELQLDSTTPKANLQAKVYPALQEVFKTTWAIKTGSDTKVVEIDPSENGNKAQSETAVTGLTPGKTIINLTISGQTQAGSMVSLEKEIPVTVKGTLDALTSPSLESATFTAAGLTLTTGMNLSPSATFTLKANSGQTLSDSAFIKTSALNGVTITPNDATDTITITPSSKNTTTANGSIQIWLAADDGTELTNKVTLNIKVEASTKTASSSTPMKMPTVRPSLTLSSSKVDLTAKNLEKDITATVTGVSGKVEWTVISGADIVKLTGSDRNVKITGLYAGTAKITAKIGNLSRTITVNVTPTITLSDPAAASSAIEKNKDGTYTWSRKATGARTVKLTFTSDIPLLKNSLSVDSTVPDSLDLYNAITLSSGGKSGSFQLDFKNAKKSPVKITFKAGGVTKVFTFNLSITGNESGINIAGTSGR